jgi:hypothetical protein
VEGLVEEKGLFVSLGFKGVECSVFAFFLSKELRFAFLEDTLNGKLVLVVLVGATDTDGGIFKDELGVALGRQRADEVKLALRQLDQCFLCA